MSYIVRIKKGEVFVLGYTKTSVLFGFRREMMSLSAWQLKHDFPLRVFTAYGPQLYDSNERKQTFCGFLFYSGKLKRLIKLELVLFCKWTATITNQLIEIIQIPKMQMGNFFSVSGKIASTNKHLTESYRIVIFKFKNVESQSLWWWFSIRNSS